MTPFTIRRAIVAGYVLALATICFFTFFTYRNMLREKEDNQRVDETLQSLKVSENILDDMQDVETGQRGYVITGDTAFLSPYYKGINSVKDDTVVFKNISSVHPDRKELVALLLDLVNRKIEFSAETIDVRNRIGIDSAELEISTERGRLIMDSIRVTIQQIEVQDRSILNQFNVHRAYLSKQTTNLFFVLALLSFVSLIGFFIFTRRDIRHRLRKQVNTEVDKQTVAFKDILDRISDGFIAVDRDWKYVYVNEKAASMMNKRAEELMGRSMWDESKIDNTDDFYKAVQMAMNKQEHVILEDYDGQRNAWFENYIYPSQYGLSVHFKDVTEKKQAESKLKQAIDKFNVVANATNDVIWEANLVDKTMWWNDNFYGKFGYERDELQRSDTAWEKYLHPDDKDRVLRHVNRVIGNSKQDTWTDEYRFRKSDGTYLNIFDRSYIVRNDRGEATRMIGSMADVTPLLKTRDELTKSEQQLKLIFDSTADVIFLVTVREGEFILSAVNQAFLNVTEFKEEDVVGRNIRDVIPGKSLDFVLSKYRAAIDSGKRIQWEEVTTYPSGTKTGIASITPVFNQAGKCDMLLGGMHDITEQKQKELEVKTAYERFNLVTDATNDVIWDWNIEVDTVWWNNNFFSQFGYREENVKPGLDSWYDGIHPDDRDRVVREFHEAVDAKRRDWSAEYRFLKANGEVMSIFDRGFVLYHANGKPYRMIGSMLDLTERTRINAAIKRSEEDYRTLVEQATDGIFIADEQGKFIVINTSGSKMIGYSPEEMQGLSIRDLVDPDDLANNPFQFERMRKEGGILWVRKIRHKDGTVIDAEINAKFLSDGRFLAFIRDVTERKKAEQEIIKGRELADKLIDSVPGVFYFYDHSGKFIRWNKQLELVTGYSGEEIANMNAAEFFEGEDKEYIVERISSVFTNGIADAVAEFSPRYGGKIPYYFKAVKLSYEGRDCLLGTGIDITERVEAEKKLQHSLKEIRQLNEYVQNIREEERAHIAREIHDELGQQLTVLKMDVSWLNKKIGHTDDAIRNKLQNLTEMLDGTVNTVRRISSELRPSLLDDLGLVATMDWHLNEFEKRTGVKTQFIEPDHELDISDSVKTGLFRIFQESLTNVARHAASKKVMVSLLQIDEQLVLSIRDDGKGFEEKKGGKVQTLGLLGMKERTAMMGGTYDIQSEPGKGTHVMVSVPVPAHIE